MLKRIFLPTVIFFTICLVHFYWVFSYGIINDSYIFWSIKNLPGVNSFAYFWHILTHANGFSMQYRPLGFFGYYYVMGNIIGDNPIFYYLISFLFVTLTAKLIKDWAESYSEVMFIGWFSSLYYIFHATLIFPILEISCSGKYLFTSFLFMLGIRTIDLSENKLSINRGITLFFINLIAIMFHEGAIFFSIVFVIYYITRKRRLDWLVLISFSPVIAYLSIRFFLIGMPTHGIMKVGFSKSLELFEQSQQMMWNPLIIYLKAGLITFFIILTTILAVLIIKKKIEPLLYFIMSLVLLAPFLLLERHLPNQIFFKGCLWAAIPSIFLLISLINLFKVSRLHLTILLVAILTLQYVTSIKFIQYLKTNEVTVWTNRVDRFVSKIKSELLSDNIVRIDYSDILDTKKFEPDGPYTIPLAEFFPAILVNKIPNKTFIFAKSGRFNDKGSEMEILVGGGFFVYIEEQRADSINVIDRFGYRSVLNYKIPSTIRTINIAMMPYLR